MSLSLVLHDGEKEYGPYQLASASQWGELSQWVDELSQDYKSLKTLCEKGQAQDTLALCWAIGKAVDEESPPDSVRETLQDLIRTVGVGDPQEIASIVS